MLLNGLTLPLKQLREGSLIPEVWRAPLLRLVIAWAVLGAVFLRDWAAIADQAWNSSTYNHIILVPVIIAWMVLQRAGDLAKLEPDGWWPGLLFAAGAAFLWLLGAFSGLDLARQLGAVMLLASTVPALLGVRVSAGVLFPLGYMLMLVPFGDALIPPLQMITAAITISLVDLSGIPAVIDGVFIETPAGLFEVAEACSGVKFLIAMVAFGLLVANLCFVSWKRRIVFMAACIVVPILANGVRAWATIYAAQFFGAEAAAGFDHIVYGWIFFALVLALVTAGAWRYFDRPIEEPIIDADAINNAPLLGRIEVFWIGAIPALAVLGLIILASQAWARAANGLEAALPANVSLPTVEGWQRTDYRPQVGWQPHASGSDYRLLGRYRDEKGFEVDVFLALYSGQGEGREAGGFGEGALMPDSPWAWLSPGPVVGDGKSERLLARGSLERLALTWYRTGNLMSGSNTQLKLATMADRLTLTARPTAMLILSAEEREGHSAEAAIRAFHKSTAPLGPWMDRVTGVE